jgi:8-oxo-dGTP diphosphatase
VPDDGYSGPPPVIAMGGACVLFDAEGRVLLVRHTYGRLNWELPGGGSEPGESPDETAIREIREETGLDVELDRLTGVYYEAGPSPGHNHGPILHLVFLAHATGRDQAEARPPEIGAVGWWPVDDLPVPISDFTERRIRDAAAGREARVVRFEGRAWRDSAAGAPG